MELKFETEQSEDRTSLDFTDTTGAYSVSNTGGYGAPNHASSTATQAVITITPQDYTTDVIYTITIAAGTATGYTVEYPTGVTSTVVISKPFPFTSADPFVITGEEMGYGVDAEIPDQVLTINYEVSGNDGAAWDEEVLDHKAVVGAIECCLDSKFSQIDPDCGCDDMKIIAEKYAMLDGISNALLDECEDYELAQDLIEHLTAYCANENCDGC